MAVYFLLYHNLNIFLISFLYLLFTFYIYNLSTFFYLSINIASSELFIATKHVYGVLFLSNLIISLPFVNYFDIYNYFYI